MRDPSLHQAVIDRITAWFGSLPGWSVLGVTESPILGPEGNKEFLIAAHRSH
jgi:23S rRNA (cytidine1920-2'-O)/16S rRNA (cytidine1409-2'-O)-methyltransferase